MVGKTPTRPKQAEPAAPPVPPAPPKPVLTQAGQHALEDVVRGCKVWVDRSQWGDTEARKAEVLSVREKNTKYGRTRENRQAPASAAANEQDKREYYLHYVMMNKRLDEWVPGSRLLMNREVEWPQPQQSPSQGATPSKSGSSTPAPASKKNTPKNAPSQQSKNQNQNMLRKAAIAAASQQSQQQSKPKKQSDAAAMDLDEDEALVQVPDTPSAVGDVTMDDEADAEGEEDSDAGTSSQDAQQKQQQSQYSKTEEIEKLRTQGSMTQNVHEIARVKNLDRIEMGKHCVEAWYFSPYPIEYAHIPVLYVCEFCLSFYGSPKMLSRHRAKCTLLHPPGNEIYRWEDLSFFEIDGRKQKTYCRNLCLLSKAFLDHKTLYYDVDPFLFYLMCRRDDAGIHLTGYFSKEKESAEAYNLACILTLPQYQRMGYGKVLIEFSYELSKKEGKVGSPEKPLSDLGLLSYRAYWAEKIVDYLLTVKGDTSIDEVSQRTAITHADVMHTCQALQILKFVKGNYVIVLSEAVIEQHERVVKKGRRKINPDALKWKPPQFSRAQLSFGF